MCKADCSRVTHPSATNPEVYQSEDFKTTFIVRLACVKHAASVRPEPGSNSRLNGYLIPSYPWLLNSKLFLINKKIDWFKSFFSLLFSFACHMVFQMTYPFYHLFCFLSRVFLKFFNFFFIYLSSLTILTIT